MKNTLSKMTVLLFVIFSTFISNAQPIPGDSLYLGQTPPGSTPKLFQIPLNTGNRVQERIAFSPDNKQIYYTELTGWGASSSHRIKYLSYNDNKWNGPFLLFENYWNPVLSMSGDTIYFLDGNNQNTDHNNPDVWYSVKSETGWGSPVKFWNYICSKASFQNTNLGNYYFATVLDTIHKNIVISKLDISNDDTTMQSMDALINSFSSASFYIARDESYFIFTLNRNNSHSLAISYHKKDGSWTNFKDLGTSINSPGWWPWAPYVSMDNKYLFYSNGSNAANSGTYWVNLGNIIDSLRKTNFEPYLKTQINDQTATLWQPYTFTISDSTFFDDDGNNTLRYTVTLNNGSSLPAWLSFDSIKCSFAGTPDIAAIYTIKITATDTAGASVSSTFKITVTNAPSGIKEEKDSPPQTFTLDQNYPNPFNPATTIKFSIAKNGMYSLRVFNVLGQEVKQLINGELAAGIHRVIFNGSELSSGIYTYKLTGDNVSLTKKMLLVK